MKSYLLLCLSLILVIQTACKHHSRKDFYVISKPDSSLWPAKKSDSLPLFFKWYSNLVMIFDSTDKVYIYQTKIVTQKGQNSISNDAKFPNIIGLMPKQLIVLNVNWFIDYVKENNEYFRLDTNKSAVRRLYFIASPTDTIRNSAFYELMDLIKDTKTSTHSITCVVRKTTEEENKVLACKRKQETYYPENMQWSELFLDGKTKPFTSKYDSIENKLNFVIRSFDTYIINTSNHFRVKE
jgi:hypothetical protein